MNPDNETEYQNTEESEQVGGGARTAGLRPWVKGQSGNPKGRPRNILTATMRELITEDVARALMARVIEMGLSGNLEAAKLVLDRMEGRSPQTINVGPTATFAALAELSDDELDAMRASLASQVLTSGAEDANE